MPQFSVKLITYDPSIIAAFERLRKNRKHAAFTQEALKHFLATEKGEQVLMLMEGNASDTNSTTATLLSNSTCIETPSERVIVKDPSAFLPQNNSCSVLKSILE
jgi:hypothetical protein